jgi:hypothetical protein
LVVFGDKPVLGVGFDNLRYEFERRDLFKVFSENGGHSGAGVDSSLIFILATTGVLGLASFLFFWGMVIKNSKGEFKLFLVCLLLGLLVDSQFINSLFYPPIMLVIFLLAGSEGGRD